MNRSIKENRFVIDRIEGNSVVLEDENEGIIIIDIASINSDNTKPKEGDVLIMHNNSFIICKEETIKRKKEINALTKGMWE